MSLLGPGNSTTVDPEKCNTDETQRENISLYEYDRGPQRKNEQTP